MLERFFIKKKEKCPCGSGDYYKDCCYKRKDKVIPKKIAKYYEHSIYLKSFYQTCLYPNKNECTKAIKRAHALQNNRILSKLSEDNHVIIMKERKQPKRIKLSNKEFISIKTFEREGVNKAKRYTCFCNKHDDEVFAPIEKYNCEFKNGNKEQEFIYAYKSFAFEYYKQSVNVRCFQKLIKDKPSQLRDIKIINKYRNLNSRNTDFEFYKQRFDKALLDRDFDCIETVAIKLESTIKFADFSCITPRYDLHGKKIRAFNAKEGVKSKLFITIFPDLSCSYILVSCFKSDYKYFRKFIEQLRENDVNLICFYFNSIIPIYSDNIVLNPKLWNSWSKETKIAFDYYNNLNGHEFIMDKAISFALKNHSKYKGKKIDYKSSKINMF